MREAPKPKQFLTLLLILRGMQIGSQMLWGLPVETQALNFLL
jgi:hypothetical protein